MRKAMTSLVAIGISAAVYSLSDRKKKSKFHTMIEPITKLNLQKHLNKKNWKQLKKRVAKMM